MKLGKYYLFLFLLCIHSSAFATLKGSVVIDGLKYNYIVTNTDEYVTVVADNKSITEAHVLSHVTINKLRLPVTRGSSAFKDCTRLSKVTFAEDISIDLGVTTFANCTSLKEITIPRGVKAIGNSGFWRCYNLEKVVFENPDTKLDKRIFEECTSLVDVRLPQNNTKVFEGMFRGCSALKQISLGNCIDSIQANAFWECKKLEKIELPKSVKSIEKYAFYHCFSLTEIALPTNLESIGGYAFSSSGIHELEIPESVKNLEEYSMSGIRRVILWPIIDDISFFKKLGLDVNCVLYTHSSIIRKIKASNLPYYFELYPIELFPEYKLYEYTSYLSRICFKVEPLKTNNNLAIFYDGKSVTANSDGEYWLKGLFPDSLYTLQCKINGETRELCLATKTPNILFGGEIHGSDIPTSFLCGFKFYAKDCIVEESQAVIKPGSDEFTSPSNIGVMLREVGKDDFLTYTADKNGYIFATGLDPNTEYEWYNWGEYNGKKCVIRYNWGNLRTLSAEITAELIGQTQTTLTFKVFANSDESGSPKELGMVRYNGSKYIANDSVVVAGDLVPNYSYRFVSYAIYNSKMILGPTLSNSTKSFNPQVFASPVCPSSVTIRGTFNSIDAQVSRTEIVVNGIKQEGNIAVFTGLDPETNYSAAFNIYCKVDGQMRLVEIKSIDFKTPRLSLTTLSPKVISSGNVIVAAESNLSDDETNVGFEWRRTDWTDDFDSKSGQAYLYNGTMEGYIRSLNTDKLWKFRPYYESKTGKRYYGEWKGIDPTDVSYFEPTIHTYSNISVEGNSARVRGYVQRGTDNIVSQGFLYWKDSSKASGKANHAPSIPNTALKIEVDGTVMETTITDLDYETTYHYVAFVTTSEGESYYGEELSFTTGEDLTGVEEFASENDVYCEGIYDLSGHRLAQTQKGINIIRFSDGTAKKVFIR
ncbi:MAG: leucine-rich repeat domain-containing protein [Bacteroidaceae bacterium]|nr:leucine-rich repeat domain-containing protein [Bacteroidaceae bacterium]